jgi:hypothetical protein
MKMELSRLRGRPSLDELLHIPDAGVTVDNIEMILTVGLTFEQYIEKVISCEDHFVESLALFAPGVIGPSVQFIITNMQDNADCRGLRFFAKVLGRVGEEAAEAIPVLAEVVRTRRDDARIAAIEALASIRTPEAVSALIEHVPVIESGLNEDGVRHFDMLLFALGRIGRDAAPAVPANSRGNEDPR